MPNNVELRPIRDVEYLEWKLQQHQAQRRQQLAQQAAEDGFLIVETKPRPRLVADNVTQMKRD